MVRSGGIRVNIKSREIYKDPGVVERKDIEKDLPLNKWKTWIKILEEIWDLLLEFRISSKRYTRRLEEEKERNARCSACYTGWVYAIEIVASNPPVHELYCTGFWKKTSKMHIEKKLGFFHLVYILANFNTYIAEEIFPLPTNNVGKNLCLFSLKKLSVNQPL